MDPVIVFRQMIIILMMMMIGYFCQKRGYIENSHSRSMSFLVANVFNPCLVLSSVLSQDRISDVSMVNRTFLAAIAIAAMMVASAYILTCRRKNDDRDELRKTVMLRLL